MKKKEGYKERKREKSKQKRGWEVLERTYLCDTLAVGGGFLLVEN